MADWDPVVTHNPSTVFPDLALGATLTAGAGAWDPLGASVEVVAAGDVPAGDYVVEAIVIDTPSAVGIYTVQLYYGDGVAPDVDCGAAKFEIATDAGVLVPVPIRSGVVPGGTAIRGAISSGAAVADTLNVSCQFRAL